MHVDRARCEVSTVDVLSIEGDCAHWDPSACMHLISIDNLGTGQCDGKD